MKFSPALYNHTVEFLTKNDPKMVYIYGDLVRRRDLKFWLTSRREQKAAEAPRRRSARAEAPERHFAAKH